MKIQYYIYTCLGLFSFFSASAQMHIGGRNSNQAMEVRTLGANTIVTTDGKMGVQMDTPILKLDLRSLTEEGTLALCLLHQTASQARKSALRYNPTVTLGRIYGFIRYSDGTVWVPFFPKGKPRIVVMAEKNNNDVRVDGSSFVTAGHYTGG